MALQPCRTGLARGKSAFRTLSSSCSSSSSSSIVARHPYSTDSTPSSSSSSSSPTPESFKISESEARQRSDDAPRWSRTPPAMKAPVQMDFAKKPWNKIWTVNNNPERLDDMYNRLLGPGGSRVLPDELKWLAVTHKSFDQGRRGFNDKLALMGRMTLVMEATKDIVSKPLMEGARTADEFGREPFENEQLRGVDNLIAEGPRDVVGKDKLYDLASSVGLLDVVRWKPRLPRNLESSGVEVVLNGALMAIVGAVTLQHGSVVASRIVRSQILSKLERRS